MSGSIMTSIPRSAARISASWPRTATTNTAADCKAISPASSARLTKATRNVDAFAIQQRPIVGRG